MNQLTVKQALEQGYESYFYNSDGISKNAGSTDR